MELALPVQASTTLGQYRFGPDRSDQFGPDPFWPDVFRSVDIILCRPDLFGSMPLQARTWRPQVGNLRLGARK